MVEVRLLLVTRSWKNTQHRNALASIGVVSDGGTKFTHGKAQKKAAAVL